MKGWYIDNKNTLFKSKPLHGYKVFDIPCYRCGNKGWTVPFPIDHKEVIRSRCCNCGAVNRRPKGS